MHDGQCVFAVVADEATDVHLKNKQHNEENPTQPETLASPQLAKRGARTGDGDHKGDPPAAGVNINPTAGGVTFTIVLKEYSSPQPLQQYRQRGEADEDVIDPAARK